MRRSVRNLYDGITLARLPEHIDPRGPQERHALARAYVGQAWRRRNDLPDTVPAIPRNVLRFGTAR